MRHNKKFNHLGRKSAHRKAMLANMACSLLLHKRISTTVAKAKALRMYVEPLITKSKQDTTHNRRIVFSYLQNKDAVSELFREISPKIADRPGGYTRVLKTGTRLGDSAEMCIIELVDYNENMLASKEAKAKSSTRRRRGGKKKADDSAASTQNAKKPETAKVEEEVIDEKPQASETLIEETPAETSQADETSVEENDNKKQQNADEENEKKEE
jgi:large subunit ribosomal protein L17